MKGGENSFGFIKKLLFITLININWGVSARGVCHGGGWRCGRAAPIRAPDLTRSSCVVCFIWLISMGLKLSLTSPWIIRTFTALGCCVQPRGHREISAAPTHPACPRGIPARCIISQLFAVSPWSHTRGPLRGKLQHSQLLQSHTWLKEKPAFCGCQDTATLPTCVSPCWMCFQPFEHEG